MRHFPASPLVDIKRAQILRPSDLRHVLRAIDVTRRWPARDALLVLMSACVGMRCTEMARVTVRDTLDPRTARVKPEVQLRAELTKGCRPRTAYFTHPKLIAAVDRYVQDRLDKAIGIIGERDYRGLSPDLPLIFSTRRGPFALVTKRRVLKDGSVEEYEAADGVEHLFRNIFDGAGLKLASSHSGRRTFASTLLANGMSSDDVATLLGHGSSEASIPYLVNRPDAIEFAFRDIL